MGHYHVRFLGEGVGVVTEFLNLTRTVCLRSAPMDGGRNAMLNSAKP
jgi:hypothetical protein